MKSITQIESYHKEKFFFQRDNGREVVHDVYTIGDGNKVVIIIQELPGITQATLALADRFVDRGYTVVLPHLFGPIGKEASLRNFVRICISREFHILARNESSPIVDFLSALCSTLKERHQVSGVGVIGMCLTGNFAISLMINDDVLAGYASQPSLPLGIGNALHMNPKEAEKIAERLDEIGPMHCGAFEKDWFCPQARMKLLNNTFNENGKTRIIFHDIPGKGHAILTSDFIDDKNHATFTTLQAVFEYFDNQLS